MQQSKPTKFCAFCGKPAHKKTRRIWNPHTSINVGDRGNSTKETWDYMGAGTVLRRDVTNPGAWGSDSSKFVHSVTVWDGTWELNYDPFCTMTCALHFARAAYSAGYRMKEKSTC